MDGSPGLLPAHDVSTKQRGPPAAGGRALATRATSTRRRAKTTSSATTSSPASSGHSFTVANFNRGIIYLRPVTRSAHPRHEPFGFPPQTPPDSALRDSREVVPAPWSYDEDGRTPDETIPQLHQDPAREDAGKERPAQSATSPRRPTEKHTRSQSFSTVDGHTVTSRNTTEPGTFKVVIERPPFGRPKTAIEAGSFPLLEVPIPSYRLGTPRFSTHGTPMLRSSVYTRASGTDDVRSTMLSPKRATHFLLSSQPRSEVYTPGSVNYRPALEPGVPQSASVPSSARVSRVPIGPQLYDALTANPDDSGVVRFSPTGDILAATPSRLIAHITSPSFLDYELLSDFFLTFRSFLSSRDLAAYLISRLQWAVNRQDDFGRIVRVRTFVALRHWILNYFVDDFVPFHPLRAYFCNLVNALYKSLKARADGGGGDLKIVGELKKCWRRTCALYWDSEDAIGKDLADEELLPGGQVGSHTSAETNPVMLPMPSTPPGQGDRNAQVETASSNPSDQFATGHMEWARKTRHTPQNSMSSPYIPSQEWERTAPLSPESELSNPVLSCSLPLHGFHRREPANELPLYPHPVPNQGTPRFAASPQFSGPNKKPIRPSHSHKRSGSFSDALRDNRAPLSISKNTATDVTVSAISKVPGSLIRGGVFQPGTPYMDVKNGGLQTRSHLDLALADAIANDMQMRPGHAANPAVKKLIGSVRRALSSKQPSASAPQITSSPNLALSTRSSNPTSLSTVSGGVHKRRYARPRAQVRVDVLASRVADNFREAVKQQMQNDQQPQPQGTTKLDLTGFEFDFENKEASGGEERANVANGPDAQRIYSSITAGSKSIVIMDDTGAPELPFMSGALPSPLTEKIIMAATVSTAHQHSHSIDGRLAEAVKPHPARSGSLQHSEVESLVDPRRTWRPSLQRPVLAQRRSVSEGREQLHSFRRRGSRKASVARTASLRRHASYNSGLSRRNTTASIATFQTMSSDNDPFFLDRHPTKSVGPARQLRRRPGGDLRAVDNVHDLESIQRPRSTGSISNRTHSIANSVILRSDRYIELTDEGEKVHEGEGEEENKEAKKQISLVDTHSSQPNLRPSFEAEVAKLAALPDDTDDDGGIEAALMKLEGRYEKKTPDPSPRATFVPHHGDPYVHHSATPDPSNLGSPKSGSSDGAVHRPHARPETDDRSPHGLSKEFFSRRALDVYSAVESEDSFSSIPLLDRDLSEITASPRSKTEKAMRPAGNPVMLKPNSPVSWFDPAHNATSPNSSVEYVIETESMKRIPRNGTVPRSSVPRESFLLGDDESLSDVSANGSAMVAGSDRTSHGVRSFFDDEPAVVDDERDGLPMHPLRHPPTPPLTADRLKGQAPQVDTTFERGLPTPGPTPTSRLNNQAFSDFSQPLGRSTDPGIELQELKKHDAPSPPAHLPFVLAYDSETLAQQLTLVERDALDEIDWKELIELRWKQSSPRIRDWVEYLRTQDARGVDVVIARFNLVVKWTVSECLLTESIEERARCIIKYIHIAVHARRLRNYATMYQITIALLSADISRLKRTWALIPAAEMQAMRNLEALVQPLRNFHNLRVEMETASVEDGCIPFIGIYTRDLIYNAQKPAFIDAPPVGGERLVNFERHHTAAMIVKNLLRLLEASSKYAFKPEPNIISKCLWLGALSDQELTTLSRRHE